MPPAVSPNLNYLSKYFHKKYVITFRVEIKTLNTLVSTILPCDIKCMTSTKR